jgi:ribose transport system substrate-binding protein
MRRGDVSQLALTSRLAPPLGLGVYGGPASGPRARPAALIVFVAAELTDGDLADVARGVQQAASAIGWPLRILNGDGTTQGQAAALQAALSARPGGIILGGFDAAQQQAAMRRARARRIPVVGWHAAAAPGPQPSAGLFTNVASGPEELARAAAQFVAAGSPGPAGVVIFTDPGSSFETATSARLASDVAACHHCSVLQVIDQPSDIAEVQIASLVPALLQRFGGHLRYLLALDSESVDGAQIGLANSGRSGQQPPYSVTVGGGNEAELARIRADDYQQAAIAEPLNLEGWQLVDEINRARAAQPPSGYVAPPFLITRAMSPEAQALTRRAVTSRTTGGSGAADATGSLRPAGPIGTTFCRTRPRDAPRLEFVMLTGSCTPTSAPSSARQFRVGAEVVPARGRRTSVRTGTAQVGAGETDDQRGRIR